MALQDVFHLTLAICGGFCLGFGLHKSGLISLMSLWRAADYKEHPRLVHQFLVIFGLLFLIQGLLPLQFESTPYLSFWHIAGGMIFGVGVAMGGSCPLTLVCVPSRGNPFYSVNVLLLLGFFSLGVFASTFLMPDFGSSKYLIGTPLYLDQILNFSPTYFKTGLGVGLIAAYWYLTEQRSEVRTWRPAILISVGVLISQYLSISIGSTAGVKSLISINSAASWTTIYQVLFFSTLMISLARLSYLKENTTNTVERLPMSHRSRFLQLFVMGVGGGLAGGCTLGAGFEGVATLSLSGLVTTASIVFTFIVLRRFFEKSKIGADNA